MENKNKYFLKNTFIFAISLFSTKLITFFLVPLYTKTLNPSAYGIVDLLFTLCSFLFPLFTLNISESIYRFSMDKDSDSVKIINIAVICIIISLLFSLITIPILSLFPNYKNFSIYFYIYLNTLSISQILLVLLKGQERLKLFCIGNIINVFFIAAFNILFLVVYKLEINGYFLGYICANIITIIYGIIFNRKNIIKVSLKYDKKLFKEMIKYSVVLIPTSFMWWITNSSDRIMVSYFVGVYANGLYAISYKIPNLLTSVSSIFNQSWVFSAIKERDSKDLEDYTNKMFNLFLVITNIMALITLIFLKSFFKVYVSSSYYNAWKYVPFLVLGFVFMSSATFVSASYNAEKDSKGFLFSGIFGAVINIIFNFILIPIIGVYGAALATLISYIAVFIYRIIDTRKYTKIYIKANYVLMILLTIISCILTYSDNKYAIYLQIVLLIIFVILNKEKIKLIYLSFKQILKKRINGGYYEK